MINDLEAKTIFMFDVDGVLAETPHEEAWKDVSVEWKLIDRNFSFTRFYAENVAGEPGLTGAHNILEWFGEDVNRVDEFRKAKQVHLAKYIREGKFQVFKDTAKLAFEAKRFGMPVMAVSSSENAEAILKQIKQQDVYGFDTGYGKTLYELFDSVALGAVSCWNGAKVEKANHYAMAYGKIVGELRLSPRKVIVFEDAPKGIEAVTSLGFYAIGISRKSTNGTRLATKLELQRAGARIAYEDGWMPEYAKLRQELNRLVK